MGTYGALAATLGRSDRVFLVELFPGARRRLPVATYVREDGLADRDSAGRGRFHFFQNFSLEEEDEKQPPPQQSQQA